MELSAIQIQFLLWTKNNEKNVEKVISSSSSNSFFI